MANNTRSPSSNSYNTPSINSNFLRTGGVELDLGTNVAVNLDFPPTVRSNGDIVNYLQGEVVATAILGVGEVIARLPNTHPLSHSAFYPVTFIDFPLGPLPTNVFFDVSDNTIKTTVAHVLNDIISLDGIVYLSP